MSARSTRGTAGLAALLVMSAGYVDGYGLFAFGTFLSFMSGNTTLTGYNLGQGNLEAAVFPAVAVLGFLVGATIGTAMTRTRADHARRLVWGVVAALEIVAMLGFSSRVLTKPAGIAVISTAMGILNRSVTQIGGQPVSLTFVTGTLSQLGDHIARAVARVPLDHPVSAGDTQARRAGELASVWVSFLFGALLSGVVAPRLGAWALAPSAALLLVLMMLPDQR